jgi:hypothetical protein
VTVAHVPVVALTESERFWSEERVTRVWALSLDKRTTSLWRHVRFCATDLHALLTKTHTNDENTGNHTTITYRVVLARTVFPKHTIDTTTTSTVLLHSYRNPLPLAMVQEKGYIGGVGVSVFYSNAGR